MPICLTFDTERNDYETVADKTILAYNEKSFSMLYNAIPKLLDISDDYGIPYTFFLCGEVAENCDDLFRDIRMHSIGIHTHPFTHKALFKGSSPNDHDKDLLERYIFREQYEMIAEDKKLINEYLKINPRSFRAGKHSANAITFKCLDQLGITIDCSMHPPFQLIGWRPFPIPNTSVWEIPSYSDMSPEIFPAVKSLFTASSKAEKLFNGIYVGIIHPMILGNANINNKLLFMNYRSTIEHLLDLGLTFMTVEDAFNQATPNKIHNFFGNSINILSSPAHHLIRRVGISSTLDKKI